MDHRWYRHRPDGHGVGEGDKDQAASRVVAPCRRCKRLVAVCCAPKVDQLPIAPSASDPDLDLFALGRPDRCEDERRAEAVLVESIHDELFQRTGVNVIKMAGDRCQVGEEQRNNVAIAGRDARG